MSYLPVSTECGRIEMVTGCMGSEKSSYLISVIRQYKRAGKNVVVFKHATDDRGQGEGRISTHNQDSHGAIPASTVFEMAKAIAVLEGGTSDVPAAVVECVFVDEGQFFPSIHVFAEEMANRGKCVMVAGLMTDHMRRPFGDFHKLAWVAENICYKPGICSFCSCQASFTAKITGDRTISTEVAGLETYAPVCRGCHKKKYPGLYH